MNDGQFAGEIVEGEGSSSSLNDLPDDLLLLIFNRLIHLKSLCSCYLVSKRFSPLILLHVHSVYFPVPRPTTTTTTDATDSLAKKTLRFFGKPLEYFRQFVAPKPSSTDFSFNVDCFCYPISFLREFKFIRSLHMLFPSSAHKFNPNDHSLFFKWTAKFGPTIDTFVYLSTSSVRVGEEIDSVEQQQEEEDPLLAINNLAFEYIGVVVFGHSMLNCLTREHTFLDYVKSIDSEQSSLSLLGSKFEEMKNWMVERIPNPASVKQWQVPVLKLPVSRKVMVCATLILVEADVHPDQGSRDWGDEAAKISSLFSGEGEEEFAEAIVEIMVTHQNIIKMYR